jgi:hypothetical protein
MSKTRRDVPEETNPSEAPGSQEYEGNALIPVYWLLGCLGLVVILYLIGPG